MATKTRKQREIEARHRKILKVAGRHLLEKGYLGLSMDKIAAEVEYSKGTVYQHFNCKEAVVATLALETARIRIGLFETAATFRGSPRERMTAVGLAAELFVLHFPDHFLCEQIARNAVREKISAEQQQELAFCEQRCMGVCTGLVRDAIAAGDLTLPPDTCAEELAFGLWAAAYGVFSIVVSKTFPLKLLGIEDPLVTLRKNQHRLLDGYGWRPLSHEHDYEAAAQRIFTEVLEPAVQAAQALTRDEVTP
jgi:AcrR family transcriptional regulator